MKARILGLAGGICWSIVVLTHVAERFRLVPGMGWGRPNSPGHYLDLISAVGGALLLLAALIMRHRANRDRTGDAAPQQRRAGATNRPASGLLDKSRRARSGISGGTR